MTREEAIKAIKAWGFLDNDEKEILETLIPELKESEDDEDEKIRKALFNFFDEADKVDVNPMYEYGIPTDKIISWLEKQRTSNEAIKYLKENHSPSEISDFQAAMNIAVAKAYDKGKRDAEKQGEQKPDKIEPKFHNGEWIIHQGTENIYQVVAVIDNQYQLKYGDNYTVQKCADVDRCARLWDIAKDAKPGDVLASKDKLSILIFRNLDTSITFSSYYNIEGKGELGWSNNCFIPATKEQRDQLEKAMASAGYTFDFEKKELNKIEDEEYNGEDYGIDSLYHAQRILEKTLGKVDGYQTDDGILSHECAITAVKKLYEKKSTKWSEADDAYKLFAISAVKDYYDEKNPLHKDIVDWLKSIKDRVQPQSQPAWSEEDEHRAKDTIYFLNTAKSHYASTVEIEACVDWLKSLKPRIGG